MSATSNDSQQKRAVIGDILKGVMHERPPNVSRNAVYDELRANEKTIKAAIASGWSASKLAERLRAGGVKASEEKLRSEIRKIAGLTSRSKEKNPKA